MIDATTVINEHIPSLTDADEDEMQDREEIADLALRTCGCGKRIDGFYEYVDHLKEVLRAV